MIIDHDEFEGAPVSHDLFQALRQGSLEQVNSVVAEHNDTDAWGHTPVPLSTTNAVLARIWMSNHNDQRRI